MLGRSEKLISELGKKSRQLHLDALEVIRTRGQGHLVDSLSMAVIGSVIFFHLLRMDPDRSGWKERDRFILSKGHACAILSALARCGFFLHTPRTSIL